jgi:glycerol-3-phosphate dehydrogenase subunit B
VWTELSDALGRTVFEIPTLPPSVPGIRLYRRLVASLKAAGGRVVIGPRVIGAQGSGGRIEGVQVDTGARATTYRTGAVVLASGGVSAGGIALDSRWRLTETIFGLPLTGVPQAGEPRFSPVYFRDHPVDRAGLTIDDRGRPIDSRGEVVWENLYAAGAMLAGSRPWAEKSGNGISLATGWHVAGSILEGGA